MTIINSQEDFLRALSENPEWRAAVRDQILGDELRELPAHLKAFIEQMNSFVSRVESFIAAQEQFNAEQRQFNAEQRQFNAEMRDFRSDQIQFNDRMEIRMDRVNDDVGRLKGYYSRSVVTEDARGITRDMGFNYVRTLTKDDLREMAEDSGLPVSERKSFREADLVIEATDGSSVLYIALEISFTSDSRDTDRALRNARLLTQFTGCAAHPAIASVRNDRAVQALIDSGEVYWHGVSERYPEPE